MSFNRSGYIGRAPGDSSIVLAKQYFQPTGAGKTFTFTAGYDPGLIDVYRNGVKLINVLDYAATDGKNVVLETPVGVGSTVQVVAYKAFNLGTINSSANDFTVGTNLFVQSGFGSFAQGITANQINVTGIGTIGIGSFVDINVSGGATVNGTLVAGSFSGDGSALTGVGQTLNVRTESLTVAGVSTLTGVTNVTGVANFASAVNVDATTDSTSSTTGALIVDGGLGVAKNVYIGAGLSVAGTLTYEDVTNVDSVGMVTAKSGLNVSGGEVTVGSAVTIGSAGVTTFIGAAGVGVTITPSTGKVEATTYYGDGSNLSNITSTTINNNGQNKIITGSTNANTLEAESNLTFDGASFKVGSGITMSSTAGVVTFANGSATANNITLGNGKLRLYHNGENNGYIVMDTGSSGNLYIRNTAGSDAIQISNNYTALGPGQKLLVNPGGVDVTNGYFKSGVSTITSLTVNGTSGLTASGGEFKVGLGVTIASTSGIATFSKDVYFNSDTNPNYNMQWDASTQTLHFPDYTNIKFGGTSSSADSRIYQNGTTLYIYSDTGTENILIGGNQTVSLRYGGTTRLATTNDGVVVTGIMTATTGANYDGLLSEKFETTSGKLSDNTNIDLEDGMVHYFTTQETTTSTPNIRYSSSKTLNNMLSIGDAITVTIITTAAAAGYSANMTIDGSSQTEEWVGGSAPSEGGSNGLDIYTFNILKTAANTYKVIGNLVNAT